MSAICVFTPVVVQMAWPAVSSLAASALMTLGYQAVADRVRGSAQETAAAADEDAVDLEVKQSHGFESTLGEEETFSLEREGLRLTFNKGADGKLHICASGKGFTQDQLKAAGTEAMNRFLQAYVEKTVAEELKKRGFALEVQKLSDGTVRLKAKKW